MSDEYEFIDSKLRRHYAINRPVEESESHEKYRNELIAATEDILAEHMKYQELESFGYPAGHTDSFFNEIENLGDTSWLEGVPELMVEVKHSDLIRLYQAAASVMLLSLHSWLDYDVFERRKKE